MKSLFLKISLVSIYLLCFLVPGYTYFFSNPTTWETLKNTPITDPLFHLTLFRMFGLYAFTLVWSQIMLGALRLPLTRLFGSKILGLHIAFGITTLLFTFLHTCLFSLAHFLQTPPVFFPPTMLQTYLGNMAIYGYLGLIAFDLMLLTTAAGLLRKRVFIRKYWRLIHQGNYFIFILVFIHSSMIGSEIGTLPMQYLYRFFLLTFIGVVVYKVYDATKSWFMKSYGE